MHFPRTARFVPLIVMAGLLLCATRPQPVRSEVNPPLDRNIIIADRGNNRVIEVTPDKRIVWEYHFPSRLPKHGADDAFFSPDGKQIVMSLGLDNHITVVDTETKQITWSYGRGMPSAEYDQTYTPDDAYLLPDGNISVAEINNCRIAVYSPDKQLVKSYGVANQCKTAPGFLNYPNGATPLPGGGFLITEIKGARISEIDRDGNEQWAVASGLGYPSDAQPTSRGTFIVADYVKYGTIVEMDHSGAILWQFGPFDDTTSNKRLRWPSIAAELPTGYVIATDDFNHRVIVIDKDTKEIVWQYGVTGRKGDLPGYLDIPDGLDWRRDLVTP